MRTREEVLKYICKNFYQTGLAVEVGVKQGHFSKKILSHWAGKVYLVDAWRSYPSEQYRDIANVDDQTHAIFMMETVYHVKDYRERAVMIRDESVSAASLFRDKSLDWVYIDAAHDVDNCYADIQAWIPKVRDGGVIWGDDYLEGRYFDSDFGVKTAVEKSFNSFETNEWNCEGIPQWWKVLT
jgi:hypothetical protein